MKSRRRWTQRPEEWFSRNLRLTKADLDLLFRAAKREGVHQTVFARLALRERAERILRAGDPERPTP